MTSTNASSPAPPVRKRSLEITIPLNRKQSSSDSRGDDDGTEYFVSLPVEIDQKINLGDYVFLVLTGARKGSQPQLVLRPRDFDHEDALKRART